MRAVTLAILLSILAGATAAAQSVSPAQNHPVRPERPATSGEATMPQVPIGHRQPTMGDLPASVRSQEDATRPQGRVVDPFAGVPNICRDC